MEDISREARQLYELLSRESRHAVLPPLATAQHAAEGLGLQLDRDLWDEISPHLNKDRVLPRHLAEFLTLYATTKAPKRVLNLWSADGALAHQLSAALPAAHITGVDPSRKAVAVARHFDPAGRIDWRIGRPIQVADTLDADTPIDLLVSLAPFGYGREAFAIEAEDGRTIRGQDESGRVEVLRYATHLGDTAEVLLVTSTSALSSERSTKLLDALESQGIWVKAALSLPPGSFSPVMAIPAVLLIFARSRPDKIFTAELPRSRESQLHLIESMARGRRGKTIEAGVLLSREELAPLETLIARNEVERGLTASGVGVLRLDEIALAFNRPSRLDERLTFDDVQNAFFMPLIGVGPARLELPEKVTISGACHPITAFCAAVRTIPARRGQWALTRPEPKSSSSCRRMTATPSSPNSMMSLAYAIPSSAARSSTSLDTG